MKNYIRFKIFIYIFFTNNFIFSALFIENKIHIVYSSVYNTNLEPMMNTVKNALQLQKARSYTNEEAKKEIEHVFPLDKYRNVVDQLIGEKIFENSSLIVPKEPSQNLLLKVHTAEYLKQIKGPDIIGKIANQPYMSPILRGVESKILDEVVLKPQRYATSGTVLAANIAIKNHCSTINLGGGFHHCDGIRCTETSCFCFYADIQQAIVEILELHPEKKILVVDFDAHSGNGINYWLGKNEKYKNNVVIFDVCNAQEFPLVEFKNPYGDQVVGDKTAGTHTKYYHPIGAQGEIINGNLFAKPIDDSLYFRTINKLEEIVKNEKPDLIMYNAGTDILIGDPAGGMDVSAEKIVERDEYVFSVAQGKGIPVVMTLAGGYKRKQKEYISFEETPTKAGTTEVIIASIKNLVKKGFINTEPRDILIDEEISENYLDKNYSAVRKAFNKKIIINTGKIEKKVGDQDNNNKEENNKNDLSTNQKTFIGAAGGIFVCIALYCFYYEINPMTVVVKLFNKQAT